MQIHLGIDVSAARGCPMVALGEAGEPLDMHIATGRGAAAIAADALAWSRALDGELASVGIDAPRTPLPARHHHSWRGGRWRHRAAPGTGRHCEVVIKSLGLANPQWTPAIDKVPEWMRVGFALFGSDWGCPVHEVFPSAAYRQLDRLGAPLVTSLDWSWFADQPKDILDAWMAAVTVREVAQGRGGEVGGGDGLGTIVLPRPVVVDEELARWPG